MYSEVSPFFLIKKVGFGPSFAAPPRSSSEPHRPTNNITNYDTLLSSPGCWSPPNKPNSLPSPEAATGSSVTETGQNTPRNAKHASSTPQPTNHASSIRNARGIFPVQGELSSLSCHGGGVCGRDACRFSCSESSSVVVGRRSSSSSSPLSHTNTLIESRVIVPRRRHG